MYVFGTSTLPMKFHATVSADKVRAPDSCTSGVTSTMTLFRSRFPDYLSEDRTVSLLRGRYQAVWLTFAIPSNAAPGVYKSYRDGEDKSRYAGKTVLVREPVTGDRIEIYSDLKIIAEHRLAEGRGVGTATSQQTRTVTLAICPFRNGFGTEVQTCGQRYVIACS